MREKPSCDNCRKIYERKLQAAPCMDCQPYLIEANEDAVNVYSRVANQVIVGGMGIVLDIDYNSIAFIMDLLEIKDRRSCFEKIVTVFHHFMEIDRQQQK